MEERIIIWLQSFSNTFYDMFFQAISYLVSWIGALCLFLVVLIFLDKRYALCMGFGYLITVAFNYILKVIIARPRPYVANEQIINKLTTIGHSCPSGHSVSVVFIVLALLCLFSILCQKGKMKIFKKTWFKIIAYSLAVLLVIITAIARMYLGQHYISDIIIGIVFGVLGFVLTYLVYNKINSKYGIKRDI